MRGSKRPSGKAGVWRLRVYIGQDPLTGKPRLREKRFHGSSKQADKALADMVRSASGSGGSGAATLSTLIDEWLELIEADRSPATIEGYRSIAANHVGPALGAKRLDDLKVQDLDRFYRALRTSGLSAARVTRIHAVIRAALGQAVKWGWVDSNLAQRATIPGGPAKDTIVPTNVEMQQLLDSSWFDPEFAVLLRVAVATGARRGELAGLQWRDVDLTAGTVSIERAVVRVGGVTHVKAPKSKRGVRTNVIDPTTVEVLTQYRAAVAARAKVAGVRLGGESFVWSREADGSTPLNPDVITGAWRRLCTREGMAFEFKGATRHFHVTLLRDSGIPESAVAERVGHGVLMTRNIYTHAVKGRDREAAEVFGELMP